MRMKETFYSFLKEHYLFKNVSALLEWDQQICLPANGHAGRAEHNAFIATLHARHWRNCAAAEIIEAFAGREDLSAVDQMNLKEAKRQLSYYNALPEKFVSDEAREIATCFRLWEQHKPEGNFAAVTDSLSRVVDFAREKAERLGYQENRYDALLNLFEPGLLVSEVDPLLQSVTESLQELLPAIEEKTKAHFHTFPVVRKSVQKVLSKRLVEAVGYDFNRGRLDEAAHPFETSPGPGDVRLATRFIEDDFSDGLLASLHEFGHALYELGLPEECPWTAGSDSVSMAIHESQSLFWESFVGRSEAFAHFLYEFLRNNNPEIVENKSERDLWEYFNRVKRGLIRVAADEVSYCLHIRIRFEAESALLNEKIQVKDLPEFWRAGYKSIMGIEPSNHKEGVMQDVHWYAGLIGYFPSYALGYLYAGMLHRKMKEEIADYDRLISQGNFQDVISWLNSRIHGKGKALTAQELITDVTGRKPGSDAFIAYLKNKFV